MALYTGWDSEVLAIALSGPSSGAGHRQTWNISEG